MQLWNVKLWYGIYVKLWYGMYVCIVGMGVLLVSYYTSMERCFSKTPLGWFSLSIEVVLFFFKNSLPIA